jgi:hypothetical protein
VRAAGVRAAGVRAAGVRAAGVRAAGVRAAGVRADGALEAGATVPAFSSLIKFAFRVVLSVLTNDFFWIDMVWVIPSSLNFVCCFAAYTTLYCKESAKPPTSLYENSHLLFSTT